MSKKDMIKALTKAISQCKKATSSAHTEDYAKASGNALAVMENVLAELSKPPKVRETDHGGSV